MVLNKLCLLTALIVLLAGCSDDPPVADSTHFSEDPKGLQIDINSSSNLNSRAELPSTVAVLFLQSNDLKALTKLSQNKNELDKLLVGEPSQNPAVISADRFVVQPAARDYVVLPRRQDAKGVLVYAGYFSSPLAKAVRVLEFPIVKSGGGMFGGKESGNAAPLYLFLNLNDTSVDRLTVMGPDDITFPDADDKALQGREADSMPSGDGKVQQL